MTLKEEIKERLTQKRPVRVFSYIHGGGRIGAMIEIESDTDFGLNTEPLEIFAHDVCMHVAAANPVSIHGGCCERADHLARVREGTDAPPHLLERIIDGKMAKWDKQYVLLAQPWIKDENLTISDLLKIVSGVLREQVTITKIARFGR